MSWGWVCRSPIDPPLVAPFRPTASKEAERERERERESARMFSS